MDQATRAQRPASPVLSDAELEHYRTHGYVFPRYCLPPDLLAELRTALDGLLASYTDVKQEDLAEILGMLSQILGPDLVLWITRVLCKPASKGREVPWHQDGEYWPMRPLATCSVWIALDPVSTANGCMRFIPGSHKRQEPYRHHVSDRKDIVLNLELDQDQFDESQAVNVELEPGQMSLHDVRLIHGSLANTSGQRRAALIMRYMPSGSHYDRSLVDRRRDNSPFNIYEQPLWLVNGTDRSGKNDFVRGHAQWNERYARGLAPVMESEG
jgi:hypothetical protein